MPLLTQPEAAAFLRTPARTLEYWRSKRSGPPWLRIGKRIVYLQADLEAYVSALRVLPDGDRS